MKLLKFEWLKLWRQKKLIVVSLIVALCVTAIYFPLGIPMEKKKERAVQETSLIINQVDQIYGQLYQKKNAEGLSDIENEQFNLINQMATDLFHRTSSIYNERWAEIPVNEQSFIDNLHAYEGAGGTFTALEGVVKKQFIEKNAWMIAHELAYDDEINPTSPALFIKHTASFLFSLAGVLFLLILFGNLITREKEQNTWLTLQTQPITRWKMTIGKYLIGIFGLLTFIVASLLVSLLIPMIFSEYPINFSYPQLVTRGDQYQFISTSAYLLRHILLFSSAFFFALSLIFFISKFIRNSFPAIITTILLLATSVFTTENFGFLQVFFNPFYVFQFTDILNEVPHWTHHLLILFTIAWSAVLLTCTIVLPDKDIRLLNRKENHKAFSLGSTSLWKHPVLLFTRFEWRKAKRNTLMKQLFVILSLFVVVGYFMLDKQAEEKKTTYLLSIERFSSAVDEEILQWANDTLEMQLELLQEAKDAEDAFLISLYEEQVEMTEDHIQDLLDDQNLGRYAIEGMKEDNWVPLYEYQLYQNQKWLTYDSLGSISSFTVEANIAEKEWLLEHDIQPVFFGDFQTTIYDYFDETEKELRQAYENDYFKVDSSGLFSLYFYFKHYIYFVPLLLFVFLFGAGLSNERGKRVTLRFLKTEPILTRQVIGGKSIFSILISIASSLGVFLFVLLVSTVFNRFGDWKYPILHFDSKKYIDTLDQYEGIRKFEGAGHFIYLGDYLISATTLFLGILLFLLGFSTLLSLLFKRHVIVFGLTVLTSGVGYYLSRLFMDDRAHLSPFTYFNIGEIASGERSALLNNPFIHLQNGCLILVGFALLFFTISYLLANFHRKSF